MARARPAQPPLSAVRGRPRAGRLPRAGRRRRRGPGRRRRRAAGRGRAAGCRPGRARRPGGRGSTRRGSGPRRCSRAGGRRARGRSRAGRPPAASLPARTAGPGAAGARRTAAAAGGRALASPGPPPVPRCRFGGQRRAVPGQGAAARAVRAERGPSRACLRVWPRAREGLYLAPYGSSDRGPVTAWDWSRRGAAGLLRGQAEDQDLALVVVLGADQGHGAEGGGPAGAHDRDVAAGPPPPRAPFVRATLIGRHSPVSGSGRPASSHTFARVGSVVPRGGRPSPPQLAWLTWIRHQAVR